MNEKKYKRIFTVVIDSLGAGEMSDAASYGDAGTDTLGHIAANVEEFKIPNLQKLGIANLKDLAGVLCGMTIITLSKFSPVFGNLGIWCGIITFVMCIIAKSEWFDFCPGTFMGCFTTFAADGNWSVLAISLVIGAFLGLACEYGGNWLYQAVTEKKECDTYMGENVLQEKKEIE